MPYSKKYKIGVCFGRSKFQANILINGTLNFLGDFNTENEAAMAYDNSVRAHGLKRRLNFPDESNEPIIPNTRLIQLTKGKFAVVDESRYEYLNQFKWHTAKRDNLFYAARRCNINGESFILFMHNEIMNSIFVDHINHNGLHNYEVNLRSCTRQQNQRNMRKQVGKSSIYKGVCWNKAANKWMATITNNYKSIYIGLFHNEIDAALAYDAKAAELFGEFACLNFPY